jgi:NAD(P)-dependent dehydrogenase (short-subunit alcohol dehydrogenase family)
MNLNLENKIALITGGAQGIGEAITRAFADEKAIPVIFDQNEKEAKKLVDELSAQGKKADFVSIQLIDAPQVEGAIKTIGKKYGRIDILVNNAGRIDSVTLDHDTGDFRKSLDANLIHFFTCVRGCLPFLKASRGCIVNIGSKVSVTGMGGISGYAASKGAINALTREWATDLVKDGIRVNCVLPAEVFTSMYETWLSRLPDPASAKRRIEQMIPLGRRMTTPSEIANTVIFLASECSSHTTGQILFVDGGYVHLNRALTNA